MYTNTINEKGITNEGRTIQIKRMKKDDTCCLSIDFTFVARLLFKLNSYTMDDNDCSIIAEAENE